LVFIVLKILLQYQHEFQIFFLIVANEILKATEKLLCLTWSQNDQTLGEYEQCVPPRPLLDECVCVLEGKMSESECVRCCWNKWSEMFKFRHLARSKCLLLEFARSPTSSRRPHYMRRCHLNLVADNKKHSSRRFRRQTKRCSRTWANSCAPRHAASSRAPPSLLL
jgi:hypothetical protein